MKNARLILSLLSLLLMAGAAESQTLNWKNLETQQKHLLSLQAGIDYGTTMGISYGYHFNPVLPMVLRVELSKPAGHVLFDDFKSKAGVEAKIVEWKRWVVSAEAQAIFRRYQTPYARLLNFGSEFSGMAGYYRPSWFIGAQAGFDKAIVTQFKNTELLMDLYPEIQNGWYQPATGGNFYYGLAGGCSFGDFDCSLAIAKVIQQDFTSSPLIPFYTQIGVTWKAGKE